MVSPALTPCVIKAIKMFTYTNCTASFSLIAKLSDNLPKKQNNSENEQLCTRITKLCMKTRKYQN